MSRLPGMAHGLESHGDGEGATTQPQATRRVSKPVGHTNARYGVTQPSTHGGRGQGAAERGSACSQSTRETSKATAGRWPGRGDRNVVPGLGLQNLLLLLCQEHDPVPGSVTATYIRHSQTPAGSEGRSPHLTEQRPCVDAWAHGARSPSPTSAPAAGWPGGNPPFSEPLGPHRETGLFRVLHGLLQ